MPYFAPAPGVLNYAYDSVGLLSLSKIACPLLRPPAGGGLVMMSSSGTP